LTFPRDITRQYHIGSVEGEFASLQLWRGVSIYDASEVVQCALLKASAGIQTCVRCLFNGVGGSLAGVPADYVCSRVCSGKVHHLRVTSALAMTNFRYAAGDATHAAASARGGRGPMSATHYLNIRICVGSVALWHTLVFVYVTLRLDGSQARGHCLLLLFRKGAPQHLNTAKLELQLLCRAVITSETGVRIRTRGFADPCPPDPDSLEIATSPETSVVALAWLSKSYLPEASPQARDRFLFERI